MNRVEALDRLAAGRSGHLATVRPDGRPHVVVVTFALIDEHVVTAIDHKPKTTHRLQRLINIETNPAGSFLVDHYADEWDDLWWVRIDGAAAIHTGGALKEHALEALKVKYAQYQKRPPEGPAITIGLDDVSSWSSSE